MKRLGLFLVLALGIGLAWASANTVGPVDQVARWMQSGAYIGTTGAQTLAVNRLAKRLGGTVDYDFPSTTTGVAFSSAVTRSGAALGDQCTVSTTLAANAALNADFGCVVTAADTVKVTFRPRDTAKSTVALVSGTPSTAIIPITASSICNITPGGATAAIAAAGAAYTVTLDAGISLLTITGPNTVSTTMTYDCAAPVDPTDAGYNFQLTRNGS